jgi:hypothetical protein
MMSGAPDLRQLALIIARAHDLTASAMVEADKLSDGNDDLFLTAIQASADLEVITQGGCTNDFI